MKGQNRSDIKVGKAVGIVLKEDQVSGKMTRRGFIEALFFSSIVGRDDAFDIGSSFGISGSSARRS
jgi:uncharacterized repeat protein (TIGR03833 family)